MPGALLLSVVYQHSLWIHIQAILKIESGFVRDSLYMWSKGAQATRLSHAVGKGSFHIFLLKTQRFFMLDQNILNVKIHPMRATLYSIVKL